MLPRIAQEDSHSRLQHAYHMRTTSVPSNIFAHCKLFTNIFNYQVTKNPWATQILFFTKKWLEPHPKNLGWFKLKEYWAQEAWGQSLYWLNKMIFDFNWETYIAELVGSQIKLKPYLLDTVKHLLSIACGFIPGFRAADDSQLVLPTQVIQDAYVDVYRLKKYPPTILHPDFLRPSDTVKRVYYSLQAPTLPENHFDFEKFSSVVTIIRELKEYMDIFLETLRRLPVKDPTHHDLLDCMRFEYFHTEDDEEMGIQHTSVLPSLDATLTQTGKFKGYLFPENATFLRGCVGISLDMKG